MQVKSVPGSYTLAPFLSSMMPEHLTADKKEASRQNKAELRWDVIEQRKEETGWEGCHGGTLDPLASDIPLLPS